LLVELPGGFVLPLEWVIGLAAVFAIFIPLGIFGIYAALFRRQEEGPDEEDIAAVIPVDEHETIQRGKLIGKCQRTEDELLISIPDWQGEEQGVEYATGVDIAQKVPFPLSDASGKEKRLWIIRDKGHMDAVSASTIVSEKIPKRWDLPLIDPRRIFRHLEGPRSNSSITNALTTKTGIITVLGILGFGAFMSFFIVVASGHFH